MPLFGVDVSHWRGDVDWPRVRAAGIGFAFAKVSEGVDFVDDKWSRNRTGMTALDGFLPGGYHFLRGDADIKQQVRFFLDLAGDVSGLAVALDVETRSGARKQATRAQAAEWVAEFKRLTGGHPVFGYYPHWYWDSTGRGDLSFFDTLWASHYVSGEGTPGELYPRVPATWWAGYGSETVSILQFSSSGQVPGVPPPVDLNAYRGTLTELRAIALGGSMPLKTVVDLGATAAQTIPAGRRRSLAFEVEYLDPDDIHTDAKEGVRYPSVFPTGADAPYVVTAEVVLAAAAPAGAQLTIAAYRRTEDVFERDIRGITLSGTRSVLTSVIRMSDQHKYRADIVNNSANDIAVQHAYLLIAR